MLGVQKLHSDNQYFTNLPDPLQIIILRFLEETEQFFAANISKKWNKLINEKIFQPKCLASSDLFSWRVHYFACESLNRKMRKKTPEPTILLSTYVPPVRSCTILSNAGSPMACFVFNRSDTMNINAYKKNNIKSGDYVFQVFDMQLNVLVKTINCIDKEWIRDIDFGYPYLLTVVGNEIFIRDLNLEAGKELVHHLIFPNYATEIPIKTSVNQDGICCCLEGQLIVAPLTKSQSFAFTYLGPCSLVLLHQKKITYQEEPGLLIVRDTTKDFPLLAELSTAERIKMKNDETAKKNFDKIAIKTMIASDQFLIARSEEQVSILELKTFTIVRTLSLVLDPHLFTFDAVIGHTFFIHSANSLLAYDFDGHVIKTWNRTNGYFCNFLKQVSVYENTVYVLDRNESDAISILVFDFYREVREKENVQKK